MGEARELRDQVRLGPAAVWRKSLVVLVHDDVTQSAPGRIAVVGPAAAPTSCVTPESIAALPGGGLAIAGTCKTHGTTVERWDRDGKVIATDEVLAEPSSVKLRATRAGELVAFGHLRPLEPVSPAQRHGLDADVHRATDGDHGRSAHSTV